MIQHIVIAGLLYSQPALALPTKKMVVGPNTVEIYVPNGWQYAKEFLKAPLILLGPFDGVKRPALSVSHSGQKNIDLKSKKFWGSFENYKKGRKKWLDKNGAKSLGFIPFRTTSWKNLGTVVSMGHKYEVQNLKYEEINYYFNCNSTLYNISTLMTYTQKKKYSKEMNKVLKSIKCLK